MSPVKLPKKQQNWKCGEARRRSKEGLSHNTPQQLIWRVKELLRLS